MAANLNISPHAETDTGEIFGWYEERREGLGEEFLAELDRCLEFVCENPVLPAIVVKDYRRTLLHRFPYAVFYRYKDDVVHVYCVLHTARSPGKWRKRLK